MSDGSNQTPSLSDWITFLSSEKNPNLGNIFSLGALVLAALAVILPITTHNDWLGLLIFGVLLMWVFYKFAPPFARRGDKAGKLLDRIMSGELRDPSKIEKEWNEVLDKEKKTKKKGQEAVPATKKKAR